jgi:flagellin
MTMSLVLNTNYSSLVAQGSLASSGSQLSTALQQLSSGLRINTAADDAAGYAIVQGMTAQIGGLNQAAQNASGGVSLTQTAQGALTEITNDLQSMRNLAVESLNATNSTQDRANLNQVFQQLSADIDNVAKTTQFNGVNLLDGSFQGQTFQIGANVGQSITVSAVSSARTGSLGLYSGVNAAGLAVGTTGASTIAVGGQTVNLGTVTADAAAVASALNNSGVAGLTATANATSVSGAGAADTGTAGQADTLSVNGVTINLTNSGNTNTNVANAVQAINAVSANTGVTASASGTAITLANTSGANIAFTFTAGAAGGNTASVAADYGVNTIAATTKSTVNVSYVAPAGVTGNLVFTGALANTSAIGSTGAAVSALTVSTTTASNTALTAIDQALHQIASTGAQLGAYQDRFQAAITGLNTDSTNLQSARSAIQDTDYASATTALSKAQILQQAGTAMVAQANMIPQNVLSLLQKLP